MKLLRKMKGKKGFTFVEMLIVITILAIITAVAAPGVASYTKRFKLMELDDSARAIYMAVQNKMVAMRSAGEDLTFGGNYVNPPRSILMSFLMQKKRQTPKQMTLIRATNTSM